MSKRSDSFGPAEGGRRGPAPLRHSPTSLARQNQVPPLLRNPTILRTMRSGKEALRGPLGSVRRNRYSWETCGSSGKRRMRFSSLATVLSLAAGTASAELCFRDYGVQAMFGSSKQVSALRTRERRVRQRRPRLHNRAAVPAVDASHGGSQERRHSASEEGY